MTVMTQRWSRTRHGEVITHTWKVPAKRSPEVQMMTYPVVLRGCIARLILPTDLTMAETQRIGRYIRTLAMDWQPEEQVG